MIRPAGAGSGDPPARSSAGTLCVVALPLGNAADLAPRAVDALRDADLILAEDTRVARRLMSRLGIERPLLSCFDANEAARAREASRRLAEGGRVVLVSDAGTPTISDPGHLVVRSAIEAGARIVPIPGPSALLAALVASGLPSDRFVFSGFLPRKGKARRELLDRLSRLPFTLIVYESPRRVAATLADLCRHLGETRRACLARELTKTHEEIVRGSLADLAERYQKARPLGEVTLVVAGADADSGTEREAREDPAERARALLDAGRSTRDVTDLLAASSGRPRREIYELVLAAGARRRE